MNRSAQQELLDSFHQTIRECYDELKQSYPHVFFVKTLDRCEIIKMLAWCEDNLTDYRVHPTIEIIVGIKDPDEAFAFKLRWM